MRLSGGHEDTYSWLFVAPPGTGKSRTMGSILEMENRFERGLLLAAKPSEADSYMYAKHRRAGRLDVEVFRDSAWAPAIKKYSADAFAKIFGRVLELYEDDRYDVIFLETIGDVCSFAVHHALAPSKVATPGDLEGKNASIAFYGKLKHDLQDFTKNLVGLSSQAATKPKHVLVSAHAQPTKEEDLLGKQTPEGKAKGVSFLGDILPSIDGSYRQDIAGEFSIVGFNSLEYETVRYADEEFTKADPKGRFMRREERYVVQLNADPEFHAKARVVPRLAAKQVPNDMKEIFRVIEEASR